VEQINFVLSVVGMKQYTITFLIASTLKSYYEQSFLY
jgi:hypothetical protein